MFSPMEGNNEHQGMSTGRGLHSSNETLIA